MKIRPILFSSAICLLVLAVMFTYFTMYSNVNGLDLFFNRELKVGNPSAATTNVPATLEVENVSPSPTPAPPTKTERPTVPPTAEPTVEPTVEPTAIPVPDIDITLSFTGDFLIHDNVLAAHYDSSTQTYDFNNAFSEIAKELSKADLTIASLEVPFGGTEAGRYSGYPKFNCPDVLAKNLFQNHIRLLFTAGIHAYDAGSEGMTRTLSVLKENDLLSTGTRENANAAGFTVTDVNGVRIGFVCYTAGERQSDGKIHANGTALTKEQESCLNVFTYEELDAFYAGLQQDLEMMKADGAEVLVVGIRWGTDYTTAEDAEQKAIAQKLCDLGVDIIAGNGPHMIQPFTAFTSEISGKTTLCMYSMGNFLSNQRKEQVSYKSGHTEDGIIYTVHLRKQSDGTILLGKIEYVPTWVSLTVDADGKPVYKILPVTAGVEEKDQADSYKRTQDIVEDGVTKYNNTVSNY